MNLAQILWKRQTVFDRPGHNGPPPPEIGVRVPHLEIVLIETMYTHNMLKWTHLYQKYTGYLLIFDRERSSCGPRNYFVVHQEKHFSNFQIELDLLILSFLGICQIS